MSSWWGDFTGVIILLMMVVFIAIWIWAWRPRHHRTFSALASLPMADAAPLQTSSFSALDALPEKRDVKGVGS